MCEAVFVNIAKKNISTLYEVFSIARVIHANLVLHLCFSCQSRDERHRLPNELDKNGHSPMQPSTIAKGKRY